jgi:GntR family transcriptional repressor for pyruvate dehydrogenase complex
MLSSFGLRPSSLGAVRQKTRLHRTSGQWYATCHFLAARGSAGLEASGMFQTLERETLAGRVTGQVERLIVERHLQPGDRLPAERELAAKLGVSRTVVREAVRSLTAKGMLEVKPGSGTIVRTPSADDLSPSMALFLRGQRPQIDHQEVMEVRRLLEVEIAGLAAQRRTEQDLATLERILDEHVGIHQSRQIFVAWDVAFHSALAVATHNDLFPLLLNSVVTILRKVREIGFDVPGSPDRALYHHRAIFRQVKRGKAEAARHAMREHLAEAEDTMLKALKLRGAKPGLRRTPKP